MFLPATREEIKKLGWNQLDVILITGDAYIDSSYIGVAVIGRVLLHAGYRVGIIAQPDTQSDRDIKRLGEPLLFWGVTSGCVDSMVSNYTPTKKPRKKDDLTPGGLNIKRPDRAVIVYTNLIRRYFKHTKPIILGGIEASLRRISHYDFWSDSVKRSVLFDAKADILVYGMGEETILELAEKISINQDISNVRGICHISREKSGEYIELPSHEEAAKDKEKFTEMFRIFYENTDPFTAKRLYQKQDTRYLVQNPPRFPLSRESLDKIFELPYQRDIHPYDKKIGEVRALETIKFSITTHRGCYGECRFCAITVHQGRHVTERTPASIIREAEYLTNLPDFKGFIHDIGGPTANMYGIECTKKRTKGACQDKSCIFPDICKQLSLSHQPQIRLLERLRHIPKIKKIFIGSGIRYDMVLNDKKFGRKYLESVIQHHVSGQMKIAPEHSEEAILRLMGKPGADSLREFKQIFDSINKKTGKKQFLTYYFIAAHPGCRFEDMLNLKKFVREELRMNPEQIQIFTPTPSTWSALMYYTGVDPFTGKTLFVEKDNNKKEKQKMLIVPIKN